MIDPIIEAEALMNRLSTGYGVTISRKEAEEIRQEIAKSKEQQRKVMSIFDWHPSEEGEKNES